MMYAMALELVDIAETVWGQLAVFSGRIWWKRFSSLRHRDLNWVW